MARLMRAHTWSRTGMGDPAGWPEVLRTAVRIMLTSRFPMVVWWGRDLRWLNNDAYRPLLGKKHPALGLPGREVWPEIWGIVGPMLEGVMASGEATWSDDMLLAVDRHGYLEETYWTYSYSPLVDDGGRVVGVFTAVTDTTERVVGERRLAALRDLGALAGRARSAAEAARLAVATLGRDPRDLPFAAVHLTDAPGGAPVAATHPELERPLPWPVEQALAARAPVPVETLPREAAALPVEGWPEPPRRAVVVPMRGGTEEAPLGALVAGVAAGRDLDAAYIAFLELVAEQTASLVRAAREYEAERARAEALAELDRAKTAFFNNVSHEFRTPLTLMLGPLEEMVAEQDGDDGGRDRLEMVHRNGLRLLRLVNVLLDFARAEAGRAEAVYEPVDLSALTRDLANVFRAATERAGLALEVDCPPLSAPVVVDRGMWETIVLNLLSNALKFTWEGGIGVRLAEEDGAAVLRVRDTGTGIPADELPRLFERFHRVRGQRARTHEGTGIGLALVRELARLHGGDVTAVSTPGEGSEFTVRIPRVADRAAGAPHATRAARSAAASAEPYLEEALRWIPLTGGAEPARRRDDADPRRSTGTILVVDDSADMRDYIARLLADEYRVHVVGDGRAALEAAVADPPDLVLSDVMMPGMDGLELVAALRADPGTAAVPVVLLSARAGEDAAVDGMDVGADDYLVKPFSARELRARVRAHLQLGRARRETEVRFRTLADSVPAMIWIAAPDGRCVFLSRGWLEFTGRPLAEELGDGWLDNVHPDDVGELVRRYRDAVAERRAFEVEYRLRRADGTYRWLVDRGAPVVVGDDLLGFVGGSLDVDDRHRDSARQALLAEVAHALDAETGVSDRLARLTNLIVDRGVGDLCAVDVLRGDELVPGPVAARGQGVRALADPARRRGGLAEQVRVTGRTQRRDAGRPEDGDGQGAHVAVPLSARGRVLGVLSVGRVSAGEPYADADLALVEEIGRRAGLAIDNARLFEEEQASARRLRLLQDATAALSSAATPTQVAEVATRHARRLLRSDSAALWDVTAEGRLSVVAVQGHGGYDAAGPENLPSRFAVHESARSGEAIWIGTRAEWIERHPDAAPGVDALGVRALALLPLTVAGRCLGVIALTFVQERLVDAADRESARVLAEQCALAMERARLLQATEDDRVVAERLRGVATALAGALDLGEVARVITEEGRRAFGADAAVVSVRDGEVLRALAVEGYEEGMRERLARMPLDAPFPLAHAVRTGEHVWLGSRDEWTRRGFGPPEEGLAGAAVAPLVVAGRTVGAIGFRFRDDEHVFSTREQDYLATLAAQCSQALDRARLHQAEHEVAETLQRSLLPSSLPELDGLALAARYRPGTLGTEAGGDWYDVLDLGGGSVALAVGDVVGKGPSAAAVMGQMCSALAAYLLDGHGPGEALARLNRFAGRIPGALATTCACVVLDTATGVARHSSAGHPAPVLRDAEGARSLDGVGGPPLAAVPDAEFPTAEVPLQPGACLLLFSDGLFERRQERLDDGLARLNALVSATACDDVEALADGVIAGMGAHHAFADDVALVAARLMPVPLRIRRPALPEELAGIRTAARRWLRQAGARRMQVDDLLIGLGEAASNAVEHAYGDGPVGDVEVSLALRGGGIELTVRDEGRWRHSEVARANGGRGLTLMRMVADEVAVDGGETGTTVRMRARLGGAADDADGHPDPAGEPPAPAVDGDPTRLTGEVDGDAVAGLREPLLQRAAEGGDLVVDLREVRYLGSAGVSLLVEVSHACEAAGGRLVVVATLGSLPRRVLALSAVDSVFAVRADAPQTASR